MGVTTLVLILMILNGTLQEAVVTAAVMIAVIVLAVAVVVAIFVMVLVPACVHDVIVAIAAHNSTVSTQIISQICTLFMIWMSFNEIILT